jgi:hypothetical protein
MQVNIGDVIKLSVGCNQFATGIGAADGQAGAVGRNAHGFGQGAFLLDQEARERREW